ncbi:MAG: hypothetical protein ACM3L6_02225 [Deltaproteobacteria bacterium]
MPEPNLTPEENLLRIIESPGQAPRGGRGMGRPGAAFDLRGRGRALRKTFLGKAEKLLTLRAANILLATAGGVATLFLVVDFWVGLPRPDFIEGLEAQARATDLGDLSVGQIDPLSVYLQDIKGRNMFALTAAAPKSDQGQATTPEELKNQAIQAAIQDIITNYKVVGIIWSEAPQAVIEDVKGGDTFMVNRGSMVKVARVKDILKDRVILSYDGMDVELR